MRASAVLVKRALRPHLSARYRLLRRAESTASPRRAPAPSRPGFVKRNFSRIVWSWLGGLVGVIGGTAVVHTLAPPALPDAGTRQDDMLIADLDQRIDEEFKVKVLRGKCLGVAKQLKGEDGGWLEVVKISPGAKGEALDHGKHPGSGESDDLISRLQGAKGLGVERLFWDRGEHKLVAIVWFGGSLCGWPGNVHGGAIATILAEKLALANVLADGKQTDVLAAATPQRLPGTGNHAKMLYPAVKLDEPTELSLSYVKPTHANQFFVIRVAPHLPLDESKGHIIGLKGNGGPEFDAVLETLDGKTCVKAKAAFAVSKKNPASGSTSVSKAKSSYTEFKEWMWPSRQQQSQIG